MYIGLLGLFGLTHDAPLHQAILLIALRVNSVSRVVRITGVIRVTLLVLVFVFFLSNHLLVLTLFFIIIPID